MPSTTNAQRLRWPAGEVQASRFLEDAGYVLYKNWCWHLPNPRHHMTDREADALGYLIFEWDHTVEELTSTRITAIWDMRNSQRGPWQKGEL